MKQISKIHSEIIRNKEPKKQNRDSRLIIRASEEKFYNYFFNIASILVQREYPGRNYELNDENTKVIEQLYYYVTANEKFEGDINKGIMICGGFGTGKTTISHTISHIYKLANRMNFEYVTTHDLLVATKEQIEYLHKRPIILDEIGRNIEIVNDFGTKRNPFNDLIAKRYENQAFTIGTSNYKYETLRKNEYYGEYIGERLLQMFNFIELKGESRRK